MARRINSLWLLFATAFGWHAQNRLLADPSMPALLPPYCDAAMIWPGWTFQFSQQFTSNYTLCLMTPSVPPSVLSLLTNIGPLATSFANTADVWGAALTFNFTVAGLTTCSGTLNISGSMYCPEETVLPSEAPGDWTNNYTVSAALHAISSNASAIGGSFLQQCITGNSGIVDRALCVFDPVGALDFYVDHESPSPWAPAYFAIGGCSVDPSDCAGVIGQPCCYPGWAQVGSLTNITSCGDRCYNCSRVCQPPPSPSSDVTATASGTQSGTQSGTRTQQPSHSGVDGGAQATIPSVGVTAFAALIGLLWLSANGGPQ